jgi:hypothetical protein
VYLAHAIERFRSRSSRIRRFDVSQPIGRPYGPAREEDECGMVMDAGLDNTGQDTDGWDAAGQTAAGTGQTSTGTGSGWTDSNMPGPRELAQDWITLWQSEISAMAADPELRESWQTIMALWAGTVSALIRGLPREPNPSWHDPAPGRARPADAPRAAPAAAAPDARDAEIERLTRHVAALERRLANLEHGGDPPVYPKGRSGGKTRR